MRVLVADYEFPDTPGGAQVYNVAIIKELLNKKHQVDALAVRPLGKLSDILNQMGVNVYNVIPKHTSYDLILASHKPTVDYLRISDIQGFIIQTCHGVNDANQPGDADAFVSVSEEVRQSLSVPSTVILNGIDCDRFYPKRPINESIRRVLSLCQTKEATETVEKACRRMGYAFIYRNKSLNPSYEIERDINHADLVVSLGRGCYEAMACGRAVIIFDKRTYSEAIGDGMITEDTIHKFIRFNCSGRYSHKPFGVNELLEEFEKYDLFLGRFGRTYSINHLNIKSQVHKYLQLFSSLTDQDRLP